MSQLRQLTNKEIDFLTSDVKNQKLDIIRILKSKVKVYKLNKTEIKKIKLFIESLVNGNKVPRYLHEEEIDYILSVLPSPPSAVKSVMEFNRKQIIKRLKFDLATYKIVSNPKSIENLRDKIYQTFIKSLTEAGESVGNNSAAAIGRLLTQMSLDSFHSSGSANSNEAGLKRIQHLVSPNTPREFSTCTVHFKDKNLTKEEIFTSYSQKMKGVSVEDLIESAEPISEISPEEEIWYQNYQYVYSEKISLSKIFLRLKVNTYRCYIYDVQLKDICDIIEKTTRVEINKKSVFCICSSITEGIIDVHADEEFIRKTVTEFATSGKTFKACEKRYFRSNKTVNENEDETPMQKTYLKTNLNTSDSLKDLTLIFLTVILKGCFPDMTVLGIKGVENIRTETVKLNSEITKFSRIFNDKDLNKFSLDPYNIKFEDLNRLYYVFLDYYSVHITGIPAEKFFNFFELCGMEVIDTDFSDFSNPKCVIMMPEVSDQMFEKNGKLINRFVKKNGTIYDLKNDKEVITTEEPAALLSRKLEESENILKETVNSNIISSDLEIDYPEIYRAGYYSYAKAYGKNMFNDILMDKFVDPYFTSSDSIIDVYQYYGIESARLFLIKEYSSNEKIRKMNPVNIELLVDFQTSMGQLYGIGATDIAKQGKSALQAASFEEPIKAFMKAGTVGSKDKINNIASCLMSGKRCNNGTGICEVSFSQEYLDEESSKIPNQERVEIKKPEITNREILGSCFGQGVLSSTYTGDTDDEEEVDILESQTRNIDLIPKKKPGKKVSDILRSKRRDEVEEDEFHEDEMPDLDLPENDRDIDGIEESLFDF